MNKEKIYSVCLRFLKAFIAGAFSTAGTMTYFIGAKTWTDVVVALNALAVCLFIGGVTGVLMAGEKWANWQE